MINIDLEKPNHFFCLLLFLVALAIVGIPLTHGDHKPLQKGDTIGRKWNDSLNNWDIIKIGENL